MLITQTYTYIIKMLNGPVWSGTGLDHYKLICNCSYRIDGQLWAKAKK